MNKEEFLKSGLLEQYVLKLTDPEETELVEKMLDRFPDIKAELDTMHNAIEQYALSHSIPPPPHLKNRVLAEIEDLEKNTDGQTLPTTKRSPWLSLGSIAAMLAFAVLSLMLWLQNKGLREDYLVLRDNMEAQQAACEEQLQQALNRPLAFLGDPGTKTTILKGTAIAPQAEAIVFWNPAKKTACVNLVNLPEPPADKQYQIWADVAGKMINMGLLENRKESIQNIDYIANAESFNITLEPAGGSEHPTVDLLHANGVVL